MPYFRADDARALDIAAWIERQQRAYAAELRRHFMSYDVCTCTHQSQHSDVQDVFSLPQDTRVWVTGEHVQPGQCAYLSTRSRLIEVDNCQRLLPFVCEIGTGVYTTTPMYNNVQVCSPTTSRCCTARPALHS